MFLRLLVSSRVFTLIPTLNVGKARLRQISRTTSTNPRHRHHIQLTTLQITSTQRAPGVVMPNTLTLTTHPPFRCSHLSIPPSPFSPLSPLTPLPKPETQRCTTHTGTVSSSITDTKTTATFIPSLPAIITVPPFHWLWTCLKYSSTFPIGSTRLFIYDG